MKVTASSKRQSMDTKESYDLRDSNMLVLELRLLSAREGVSKF